MRYFHYLYQSFYRTSFYKDVLQSQKGAGISYLFFLSCVLFLPIYLSMVMGYTHWYQAEGKALIEQLPVMQIQQGKVHTSVPQPYKIYDKEGKLAAIIDTRKFKRIEQRNLKILRHRFC